MTANSGYAAFQIAKALATSDSHEDPATRARAEEKVNKWTRVLAGMLSGRLGIGSRQPISEAPVWATPEVVTGGFVTGHLLAGGPLQPHEADLLARTGTPSHASARLALNSHFLTEAGLAELTERLRSGRYDIAVPEEGALLVVAWLLDNGHPESARNVVDAIAPHFEALRFFPVPAEKPFPSGGRVHLQNVGETLEKIRRIQPSQPVSAQREAIEIWTPLYDRMIALFLETVDGDAPTIQPDAEGRWTSPVTRKFNVIGGRPCQRHAPDWQARASAVLSDYARMSATHRLCGKPLRTSDSFARLLGYLKQAAGEPRSLHARDVGMIRLILARHIAKHGGPDAEQFVRMRARQQQQIAGPDFHEIAQVMQQRLAPFPPDEGLDTLDAATRPITEDEARHSRIPPGTALPPSLCRKITRCLSDSADVLVKRGLITSGETLARVIPQFTSGLRAAAFEDETLRRLYAAIYRAFRRRRSLLLLNLEHQVRLEELPWIAAIEPFRRKDPSTRELSHQTLKEVATLTLRAFPHVILPNKLLQELRALAQGAELPLPLVEELAADIFMDDFSPKFTTAAKQAAALLEGSLYARYYAINFAAIHRLPDPKPKAATGLSWFRRGDDAGKNPFATLCVARARVDRRAGRNVARNGMVIEQAQILTTQNLAVLFAAFGLTDELRGDLRDMAGRCFHWICRRQQTKTDNFHATLIMLKNTAYAWRQMIFYLSQLPDEQVREFFASAESHLNEQSESFRVRFSPALRGLMAVHSGATLDEDERRDPDGNPRRLLGWTTTRHWLLDPKPPGQKPD